MASFTQIAKNKRARRHQRAGAQRKRKQAQRSTLSYDELFAGCGEPNDGAAKPAAKSAKAASAT